MADEALLHFMDHEGIGPDAPYADILRQLQSKLRIPMKRAQELLAAVFDTAPRGDGRAEIDPDNPLGNARKRDAGPSMFGEDFDLLSGDKGTRGLFEAPSAMASLGDKETRRQGDAPAAAAPMEPITQAPPNVVDRPNHLIPRYWQDEQGRVRKVKKLSRVVPGRGTSELRWLQRPTDTVVFTGTEAEARHLVHDASHKLYSKDREWNDLLADYLAAGFIGLFLRKYRKIHLAHHSANGSADDPEYFGIEDVDRAGGWSRFVLRYALGLEIPYLLGKYHVNEDGYLGDRRVQSKAVDNPRRFEKLSVVVAHAGLLVTFWSFGVWPRYLMWLYAAISWSPMFSRLRFLADHPGRGKLTLSTEGTWWERIYFARATPEPACTRHRWNQLSGCRSKRAIDTGALEVRSAAATST